MTQEPTYTLIQKDGYGSQVNTITGLDGLAANTLAEVLRTGDAYTTTTRQPWTCEVVRELTRVEKLDIAVAEWLGQHKYMSSAAEVVACLRHVADRFEMLDQHVGGLPLGRSSLSISLHVMGDEQPQVRMTRVDQLADAIGLVAHKPVDGHYNADNGAVRLVTVVDKPKPIVSDATIHEAEQIVELNNRRREAEGVEHGHVGGAAGGPGENDAECACGTVFAGFDTHAEAIEALHRHIDSHPIVEKTESAAAQPIPAERVDEILAELNLMVANGASGAAGVYWWDWICDQPEFDREATAASTDTAELHLVDGSVLKWRGTPDRWKRATDWPVIS